MKQASLALNAILIIAVIILYWIVLSGKQSPKNPTKKDTSGEQVEVLSNIAYFNIDSVNAKVDYIKRNSDALERKQKNMDNELKNLGKKLQNRMENFQKKAQEGGYSQVTGEAESKAIAKQQAALEKKNSDFMNQILKEQEAMSKKLNDALMDALDQINSKDKYDYILSYAEGGAIYTPNPKLDVTDDVIAKLNAILK